MLPSLALIVGRVPEVSCFVRNMASLFDLKQYSLIHFERLLSNPLTSRALLNTLEVGLVTAVVGGALSFMIGYTVVRTQVPGRRLIDMVATVPVAIPGLVIGVAYLWAWIGLPGGLYGTIWILALAFVARFIPDTVKALSTSLMQIHKELEEAAFICGRSLPDTVRHDRAAARVAGRGRRRWTLLFILSTRELGSSAVPVFVRLDGDVGAVVELL